MVICVRGGSVNTKQSAVALLRTKMTWQDNWSQLRYNHIPKNDSQITFRK